MNERTRTKELLSKVCSLIDFQLILVEDRLSLNTLVGIKNSLLRDRDSCESQKRAVEEILLKLSPPNFRISEFDRLRLKNIILPMFSDYILGWDSDCHSVPFNIAVELFNADLEYLLSEELSARLTPAGVAARDQVLANIYTTRIHHRFGIGSKVTYRQYKRLIAATQGGWVDHLIERGFLAPQDPVYELGLPSWSGETDGLCEGNSYFDDIDPGLAPQTSNSTPCRRAANGAAEPRN